jgi:hypothetical protein
MSTIDPIADMMTGGVLAGAVEPATGALAADGHTHEAHCLNCGTALAGDYCHACGQRAHVHRTISAFVHDLVHGVLHFEGKVWRTLPMLAWCPGDLTRRYIAGERARFVSPIALFLFSVFLMFAVMGWVGGPADMKGDVVQSGLQADVAAADRKIQQLDAERVRIVTAGGDTRAIDARLKEARDEAGLEKAIAKDGARGVAARISNDVPAWVAVPIRRAAENPELTLYKVQNNAYNYSWALIPLSLPFLWLLFPFSRRFRLYDHMIFVTYSLAFMTLLAVVASLAFGAGIGLVTALCAFVPPIHMFRQLKGAYGLGWWGAAWRTVLLASFAFIAAILFVALLFASGLF